MQQKILMYQIFQRQFEELRQNLLAIEERIMELDSAKEAIKDIKKNESSDTMIPIGGGFYVHGTLKGKTIVSDIGGGVMLDKDPNEAEALLDAKRNELESIRKQLEKDAEKVANEINSIAMEIQSEGTQ